MLDLIDVEVFRKALENLTNEMAITLMRASGSSVVVDTRDFCTAIFDERAEQLAFSGWVTLHSASSLMGVQATVAMHRDDPNLAPGDSFIVNDPYTSGALHQADVGIVMPLFYQGELVAWSFCNEHMLDVGGCAIGGSAPSARDVWSEALRFPPIKIAPGGVLDPGWELYIANSVRLPDAVINDLRGMIAASHTAQRKISEIIDRYGVAEFRRLGEATKDLSEQALREKISELPDGVYEADEWVEFDGHGADRLLRVTCALIIDGERVTIRLSGDPQIDALVNGAHPGVVGSIMAALLCTLTYDIPMNQGIWRHMDFDFGPVGSVVNPQPPAPVTQAHMGAGFRVGKAFNSVLAQACALSESEDLRSRTAGAPQNAVPSAMLFGLNQFGGPTVSVLLATAIGVGGGAQTVGDGQDGYGAQSMQGTRMPDVEVFEAREPMIILYRRLTPDSGGPGEFRGGLGMEEATILWTTPAVTGVVYSQCDRVPPRGFAGGEPGGAGRIYAIRKTDVRKRLARGEFCFAGDMGGTRVDWPSTSDVAAQIDDVIVMFGGGGGGLGDPIRRDPSLVARDVAEGRVTAKVAASAYGVVLDQSGALDEAATTAQRAVIRRARLGGDREPAAVTLSDGVATIMQGADDSWKCGACGAGLGHGTGNWRLQARSYEQPVVDAAGSRGQIIRARSAEPMVVERSYWCPSCGTALAVDIALAGDPPAAAARLGSAVLIGAS